MPARTRRRLAERNDIQLPGIDKCAEAYTGFQTLKRRRGVIDFDDVLAHTIRDLRRDAEFADTVRWRFRHLLVDEAQDLNPLQHTLVDLLRAGRDDLFLVGDPSQAVYGFNGADPTLLVDVETRFPGVEIVRLPVNHRSTPQIVAAGVHVLTTSGQPSPLVSNRADGPTVEQIVADDELDEAKRTAQFILRCDPNLVRTGEIAVLARTNAQLTGFADALRGVGVAVRRSATATGSPLQAAVRHAAALGSASRLRGWAHDVLDAPESHTTNPTTSEEPDPERRVAAAALGFLREQPLGDGATFRAWVATTNPFDDATTDGVDLLTFHAAKGREWHTVAVTGVESSLVPHKSASTAAAKAEEARLLYVAFTRRDRSARRHPGDPSRGVRPHGESLHQRHRPPRRPACSPTPADACTRRPPRRRCARLARRRSTNAPGFSPHSSAATVTSMRSSGPAPPRPANWQRRRRSASSPPNDSRRRSWRSCGRPTISRPDRR